MVCVNYNIIKEGFVSNTSLATQVLSEVELSSLYRDDVLLPAISISNGAQVSLQIEYGDIYAICHLYYYTDESLATNISIKYNGNSGETTSSFTLVTAGKYQALINDFVSSITITHLASAGPTTLTKVEVIAEKNETITFGTNSSELPTLEVSHATKGTLSSRTTAIPVSNLNDTEQQISVAIVPTLTKEDQYLFLSTSEEGPYYGIDDYGFQQPSSESMQLVDDDFMSGSFPEQWEQVSNYKKGEFTSSEEGLVISNSSNDSGDDDRNLSHRGIITKEFFTPQSFTADVDIRFLLGTDNGINQSTSDNSFFFALTNSMFIDDLNRASFSQSDSRVGYSIGALSVLRSAPDTVGMHAGNHAPSFAHLDGKNSDSYFSNNNHHDDWARLTLLGSIETNVAYGSRVIGDDFSEINNILNEGDSFGDFTSSALWHTWRMVYDHTSQEFSVYSNNILLGSTVFKAEAFKEGCKLWIGGWHHGGVKVQLRNFKIRYDKLYKQKNVALSSNGGIVSATVSGVPSNTSLLNDGLATTAYIAPHPDDNTKVRVSFDKLYNIAGYVLQQNEPDVNSAPDRFGITGWRADLAIASEVSYGGESHYLNDYKGSPVSGDVLPSTRSPTYSGGPVVASGIGFLEISFLNYDRTVFTNNALILESLDVYAEVWQDVTVFPSEGNTDRFSWSTGRWRNLKQSGTNNSLVMLDPRYNEVAFYPIPEYLIHTVDYGYSSAINSTGFISPENYDYSEGVFSYTGDLTGGTELDKAWLSSTQNVPDDFKLWRHFTEEIEVSVIFAYSLSKLPKEFKFQYLKEASDPNTEASWADISPIAIPHSSDPTADNTDAELRYGQYKQYKIDNNDGEFYTNNHLIPDALVSDPGGIGNFVVGERQVSTFITHILEDKIPAGYPTTRGMDVYNGDGPRSGRTLLVEVDVPIKTRGIRIVVKNPVLIANTQTESSSLDIDNFRVWSTSGHASYTSPVFDTGTVSNTERVSAEISKVSNTTTKVYVRSSDTKPEFKYETSYEVWSSEGNLGTPEFDVNFGTTNFGISTRTRAISTGDYTYLIGSIAPYVYNHVTSEWSQPNGVYPGQGTGEAGTVFDTSDLGGTSGSAIVPGTSVQERAALVDNVIYVAAETESNADALRIIILNLNLENPTWEIKGVTRPLLTKESTMCAVGRKLYFFSDTGPIFHWDIDTHVWELIDATVPLAGTTNGRDKMSSVLFNSKVYLFGDSNSGDSQSSHEVSIFDPDTETFKSGTSSPKAMLTVQPFAVGSIIYVLSVDINGSDQRYYPDEDRWEVFSSLRYTRERSSDPIPRDFYFYRQGYVYLYASNTTRSLFKSLLAKGEWSQGEYPGIGDTTWGLKASHVDLPWLPLSSDSEFMSQERYLQFKVEMSSQDKISSPTLNKVKIVTPQQLVVPASGTADVYLKVSGTAPPVYHLWYTSRGRETNFTNDHTLLYTVSGQTEGWSQPTIASGTVEVSALNTSRMTVVSSPWVLPSTTSSGTFDIWFSLLHNTSSLGTPELQWKESDIYYVNTSNPEDISQDDAAVSVVQGVAFDTYALLHPCVVSHSSTNFKMWYTAFDTPTFIGSDVTLDVGRIYFAESVDKVTWTAQQNVILPGQDNVHLYDAYSVFRPCVVYSNGVYSMWYTAQDGTDGNGTNRIVYRESTDGIVWTNLQLNIDVGSHGDYDSAGCSNPHVILDIGTYYMFYLGTDGNTPVVIRAESPDGLEWFNFKVVMSGYGIDGSLDSNGIVDFFVMVERGDSLLGDVVTSTKLKLHNNGTGV